jgi:hypothetical protein
MYLFAPVWEIDFNVEIPISSQKKIKFRRNEENKKSFMATV